LTELMKGPEPGSTRPYLIRALYEWCTDNGLTPYVAVQVDESVQVPREFVKNNEIVLNISFDATSSLKLGNEFIEFKARFGGVAREIVVPIQRVIAIYARENGQGMAFPSAPAPTSAGPAPFPAAEAGSALALATAPSASEPKLSAAQPDAGSDEPPPPKPAPGARPALKRIK
jgi:stringent starvation protein B